VSNKISIENNEERPQNRNLAGATVNAPGAKLAKSFISYVKSCFSAKSLLIFLPFIFLTLHWLSVRSYAAFCVPEGFSGWVTAIFTTASPICAFNLQLIEFTGMFYTHTWIVIGYTTLMLLKNFMGWVCGDSRLKFSSGCRREVHKKHRLVHQLLQQQQNM